MERGFSAPTVFLIAAVVGAGSFAAGRGIRVDASSSPPASSFSVAVESAPELGAGLPAGHPAVAPEGNGGGGGEVAESALQWKVPDRWQTVPNTSSMRLATYRIPRAPGDAEDPEVSVMQAGGTVEANVTRWIDQFGGAGKSVVQRETQKAGGFEVTIVTITGVYSGGMSKEAREETGWALLGAIVATPGMPHFFKMTGPEKSVKAARADLDRLVASFAAR